MHGDRSQECACRWKPDRSPETLMLNTLTSCAKQRIFGKRRAYRAAAGEGTESPRVASGPVTQ